MVPFHFKIKNYKINKLNFMITRIFYPVGQGAFYSEKHKVEQGYSEKHKSFNIV